MLVFYNPTLNTYITDSEIIARRQVERPYPKRLPMIPILSHIKTKNVWCFQYQEGSTLPSVHILQKFTQNHQFEQGLLKAIDMNTSKFYSASGYDSDLELDKLITAIACVTQLLNFSV